MATKAKAVAAPVATPSVADLMAMIQALQTAQATAPKAKAATKGEKPKAQFDAKALAKSLAGKDGVIEEKTQKGRTKYTAFCADGSIVSVIL